MTAFQKKQNKNRSKRSHFLELVYLYLSNHGIDMKKKIPARIALAFIALLYTTFGIMFFVSPEILAPNLGFVEPSSAALLEVTAVYGGFELVSGIAIFAALYKGHEKMAAYYSLVSLGGFTFGRIIGILKYGLIGLNLQFLILELSLTGLSYFSYKRLTNEK